MTIELAQLSFAKQMLINVLGSDVADRISPDAMLIDDLGADSLDMVEMQCALDDLGVEAPDEAFQNRMTVRDLAGLFQPSVPPQPQPTAAIAAEEKMA